MGLRYGGVEGQFVLQTAQSAAMVFRQHRISSHPSSQPADSELPSGKMSPGRAAVSDRQAPHAVLQLQIVQLPSLGRAAAQAGGVPSNQNDAPTIATNGQGQQTVRR